MNYLIGVDLGGTQLRAALVDTLGGVHHEARLPTGANDGPAAVIERMVVCIGQAQAALPPGAQLLGVGVGAPGPLDHQSGVVLSPPNLPCLHNIPLRTILQERCGLPVELGNDANAAAVGEWLFGGGSGVDNLVYVTVSTGIGTGVIADRRLLLGRMGSAAEGGLQIIDWQSGASWEDLASGTGLARAAARAMAAEPASALHRLATPASVTAAHVAQAAASGDPTAQRLIEREGELIGVGLVNLLYQYSPDVVLVGGSVVLHNPELLTHAASVVQRLVMPIYRAVPLRLAVLGERAGLLGAAALFLHMRAPHGA